MNNKYLDEVPKFKLAAVTPDAEKVIEKCGRVCYQSSSKDPGSAEKLISALIKSGHESVLEHASATYILTHVSRSLTHQLVRHRLASYSQMSQRYCLENQFEYVIPKTIKSNPEALEKYQELMIQIQKAYDSMTASGIPKEDARYVLPNAACTQIAVTANFREWRTIFKLRCEKHAQWEIRNLMTEILEDLHRIAPAVFEDLWKEHCCKNQTSSIS